VAGVVVQLVGLTCLLADGLGKPVTWLQDLILGLMDPEQETGLKIESTALFHEIT
jgi:hypothetical protein